MEKIKKAVPTIGKVYIEDLDNTEKLRAVIAESDILINATRAGMAPLQDVIPVRGCPSSGTGQLQMLYTIH
mgnify:CR=1 FL=1